MNSVFEPSTAHPPELYNSLHGLEAEGKWVTQLTQTFAEDVTGQTPAADLIPARPFVKWVGGKRSIIGELLVRLPEQYATYCEPFVGGGALFFAHRPQRAYLSDINARLVTTYRAVRDYRQALVSNLTAHRELHCREYYLQARRRLGQESDPAMLGSLFIYLNKACFNGMYRVNRSGEFNVAMGSYRNLPIADEKTLAACAMALRGVDINHHSYSEVPVDRGNFYYLDPPYHNAFNAYNADGFSDRDHEALADFCETLDRSGCWFMLSNSDTSLIQSLYARFNIESVMAGRALSCKGTQRSKVKELIVRNYDSRRRPMQ
jgi:DNA adenine methylase